MPRWTAEQLRDYENRRQASSAKSEPSICHEPVGEAAGEKRNTRRLVVRIASFRRRLLDPDNLTGGTKYFVDGCRYAGLIPDDNPEAITLEVSQHKVRRREDERTEIEIT